MSNAMKYIRDLEAAGFERSQAEAQVQMVLDALEGDLVTKSDFAIFQERLENRFAQIDTRFEQAQQFVRSEVKEMKSEIKETEFRLVTRLGFLTVSTVSIAVATLTWLIKT